jgi:arginyl-tRNA--protein-N-Asp/Glu arginylyltransferase
VTESPAAPQSAARGAAGRERPRILRPALFLSAPHDCGYLPGRVAASIFPDPQLPLDTALYSALIGQGFRRSGDFAYRPHCPDCNACVPVRIPVRQFRPARAQRRAWKRNADVRLTARPAEFDPEHFRLYRRYLARRHHGGGMDDPTPETYLGFLTAPRIDTQFLELREAGQLLAVAITDRLRDGLSAVYTFFDPEAEARSPGVLGVLVQIHEAQRLGLDYLYLGYWIADCSKMSYKTRFRPLQGFIDGRWTELPP